MNLSNNPKSNQPPFSRQLTFDLASKTKLLNLLSKLFGCVYLENNGNPIIGFLPQSYCISYEDVHHIFIRDSDLNYTKFGQTSSFSDFVFFEDNQFEQNNQYFSGGYIGFIDYNYAANTQIPTSFNAQPNAYIGRYLSYISHVNNSWTFQSYESNAEDIYNILVNLIKENFVTTFFTSQKCTNRWSKNTYNQSFRKVIDYIRAGDCYQINLTQEFKTKAQGQLIHVADAYWELTNPPYAGYIKIQDFELLSCSPELFIDFNGSRQIVTRPIKGTMPRYENSERDEQSKATLKSSEKDQAENLMIVDLLRNDLSVYAETGSVKTPQLFEIESFNQVHHMVSEVTATLKADVNPFDVLISALPGGSITGAPKIRAMQIIEELEGAPRGAYCGSMGYFNFDGTGSWNILIRTIQKNQDDVSIWAGGGITIASNCDAEYQECFDKVSAMVNLMDTFLAKDDESKEL